MTVNFRNKLKSKIRKSKAKRIITPTEQNNIVKLVRASINPRFLIQAPRGSLLVSCDYSSQELFAAAIESFDQQILKSYDDSVPDKITVPPDYDGEYKDDEHLGDNPDKDLHTLSAMPAYAIHFQGRPSYEWCCIARNTIVTNGKSIRAIGKYLAA